MSYDLKSELDMIGDIAVYQSIDEEDNHYIAENLFGSRVPGSGRAARDIIQELKELIEERQEITHPQCLFYQDVTAEAGDYYLIREDKQLTPLSEYLTDTEVELETVIDWMKTLADIYQQVVAADLDWSDLVLESLWVDQAGKLVIVDPIVTREIIQYRPEIRWEMSDMRLKPLEVLKKESWTEVSYIYTLGILLYYLVTDQPPFTAENNEELFAEIKHISPLEPKLINKQISPALNELIMDCLEKEKEKREGDLEVLFERLAELEENNQLTASPEQKKEVTAKENKLKKWFNIKRSGILFGYKYWKHGVVGLVILLAFLGLFTVGGYTPKVHSDTRPRKVVNYFYQSINIQKVNLLDEVVKTDEVDYLSKILIRAHVVETGHNLFMSKGGKDDVSIYSIKNLNVNQVNTSPPKFKTKYKFVSNYPNRDKVTVDMQDTLLLKQINNKWKIVNINGNITNHQFLTKKKQ